MILDRKIKDLKKKKMKARDFRKQFREHDRLVQHVQKIRI